MRQTSCVLSRYNAATQHISSTHEAFGPRSIVNAGFVDGITALTCTCTVSVIFCYWMFACLRQRTVHDITLCFCHLHSHGVVKTPPSMSHSFESDKVFVPLHLRPAARHASTFFFSPTHKEKHLVASDREGRKKRKHDEPAHFLRTFLVLAPCLKCYRATS